jgi:hypothetical protein
VSADDPLLDRATIEDAFRRLGDRLARRGIVEDLYVFGGAAMALAYDARRATRDIDAVFQPHGVVLDEARTVAEELGLPQWWLNEQASVYFARSDAAWLSAPLMPGGEVDGDDVTQSVGCADRATAGSGSPHRGYFLTWAFARERVTGIEPASRALGICLPCQVMPVDLRMVCTFALWVAAIDRLVTARGQHDGGCPARRKRGRSGQYPVVSAGSS